MSKGNKKPFPKAMAWILDKNLIVGFTSNKTGTVIASNDCDSPIGEYSESWNIGMFTDLPDDHPLASWPNVDKPAPKQPELSAYEIERIRLWREMVTRISSLPEMTTIDAPIAWADAALAEFDKRFKPKN